MNHLTGKRHLPVAFDSRFSVTLPLRLLLDGRIADRSLILTMCLGTSDLDFEKVFGHAVDFGKRLLLDVGPLQRLWLLGRRLHGCKCS